jgi:tetratricopeptide (TPR) repeat protein
MGKCLSPLWRWTGLALALCCTAVQAVPRTPTQDSEVIERLPFRPGDTTARELSALRATVAKNPADPKPALALARRYFELATARGDPRYVGYADALVERFSANMSAPLLAMRGTVRQYRHDFTDALNDYAAALKLDTDLAGANAWRGAIYLVQADYVAAAKECEALLRLGRSVLHGGCAGLTQAYTGHLDTAYKTLQKALAASDDDDQRLWLNTRLAEVADWQGQTALAEQHFRRALDLGIDDGYLLAAWSDFLLDKGDAEQVIQQLTKWDTVDGLLLRLSEAEDKLKRPVAKAHIQALGDRFAAAKLRGDTTHQAEEARFHLHLRHDPKEAVRLAVANYQVQKEPRDARIVLESALADNNPAAAQPVLDWLRTSGFEGQTLRKLAAQVQQLSAATTGAAK